MYPVYVISPVYPGTICIIATLAMEWYVFTLLQGKSVLKGFSWHAYHTFFFFFLCQINALAVVNIVVLLPLPLFPLNLYDCYWGSELLHTIPYLCRPWLVRKTLSLFYRQKSEAQNRVTKFQILDLFVALHPALHPITEMKLWVKPWNIYLYGNWKRSSIMTKCCAVSEYYWQGKMIRAWEIGKISFENQC